MALDDEDWLDLEEVRQELIYSGQEQWLGQTLAQKGLEFLFRPDVALDGGMDNAFLEEALSYQETRDYLSNQNNLESFASELANISGQFRFSLDEGCSVQPAYVLKGENVQELIIQKIDSEGEAFATLRDKVVYSAFISLLFGSYESVSDVNDILTNPCYQRFISDEQTKKAIDKYADNLMKRFDFGTIEEAVENEAFSHLFTDEFKAKVKERKMIAEGKGESDEQPRIPLHNYQYDPQKNEEFRTEVDYAIEMSLPVSTGYYWSDLMENHELHKYLRHSPENREDFFVKVVQARKKFRDKVLEINKDDRTLKYYSARFTVYGNAINDLRHQDFLELVTKESDLSSQAFQIAQELVTEAIEYFAGSLDEYNLRHDFLEINPGQHRGDTAIYLLNDVSDKVQKCLIKNQEQ